MQLLLLYFHLRNEAFKNMKYIIFTLLIILSFQSQAFERNTERILPSEIPFNNEKPTVSNSQLDTLTQKEIKNKSKEKGGIKSKKVSGFRIPLRSEIALTLVGITCLSVIGWPVGLFLLTIPLLIVSWIYIAKLLRFYREHPEYPNAERERKLAFLALGLSILPVLAFAFILLIFILWW